MKLVVVMKRSDVIDSSLTYLLLRAAAFFAVVIVRFVYSNVATALSPSHSLYSLSQYTVLDFE